MEPTSEAPPPITKPGFTRSGTGAGNLIIVAREHRPSLTRDYYEFKALMDSDPLLKQSLIEDRDTHYKKWDAHCERERERLLRSGGRRASRRAPEQGSEQQQQQEADDRAEAEKKAVAEAERKTYFDAAQKAYSEDTDGVMKRFNRRLVDLSEKPWSYAVIESGMCVCNSAVCYLLAFALLAWIAASRWRPAAPAKKARRAGSKAASTKPVLNLIDAASCFPKLDPQSSREEQILAVTEGTCEAVTLRLPRILAFDTVSARRKISSSKVGRYPSSLRAAVKFLRRKTDPSAPYPAELPEDQCLDILVAAAGREYKSPIEKVSEECTATVEALRETEMPIGDFLDTVNGMLVITKGSMAITNLSVVWMDGAQVDTKLDAYLDAVAQGLVPDMESFWQRDTSVFSASASSGNSRTAMGTIFTEALMRRKVPVEEAGAFGRISLLGVGEGNGAAASLLSMEEPMLGVVEFGAVQELDSLGTQVSGNIIVSFERRGHKLYALVHRDLLVLANEVTLACICWMIGVLGPCLFAKPGQKTEPFGPVKKLVRGDKAIVVGKDSDNRMMCNLRTVFFPMAAQIDSVLAALIKTLVALGVELRYDRSPVARRS